MDYKACLRFPLLLFYPVCEWWRAFEWWNADATQTGNQRSHPERLATYHLSIALGVQTWKWNNKTNGSRIIFQLTMSRPSFPACSALYCPPFKYGRLIYPQTAIRAGTAKLWSAEAFQEFLENVKKNSVLLKPLVHPQVWPFKCFLLFQMVWSICHSVARWEWRCCHGFPQWSAGTGQEGWSECIPQEHWIIAVSSQSNVVFMTAFLFTRTVGWGCLWVCGRQIRDTWSCKTDTEQKEEALPKLSKTIPTVCCTSMSVSLPPYSHLCANKAVYKKQGPITLSCGSI